MYTALLTVHSYLRWLVLIVALVALARAIGGMTKRRPWDAADDTTVRWLTMSLDIQMLIGLIIFFVLSPFTIPAWSNLSATMRDAPTRFIMVEHQVGMLLALALAHVGRARIRKTADPVRRHRIALIFVGLSLLVMLVSIPWPGRPGGRALLRGFDTV
jgi:hypothetical protein